MDGIRQYLLSVTAAAILCACVRTLADEKGSAAKVVNLICGLFLAFTVVRPVADIQIQDFALFTADLQLQAQAAAASGQEFTRESISDIIKEETEAYILDKAEALNAKLHVEVTVSDDAIPTPKYVRISGQVSPYTKGLLQSIIEQDLGIAKEDQQWTG